MIIIQNIRTHEGKDYDISKYNIVARGELDLIGQLLIIILERLDKLEENKNVT